MRRHPRTRGTAAKKKEPLTIERLLAIVAAMPEDLPALRDRALILLGYAGAFRRLSRSTSGSSVFEEGALRLDRRREERSASGRSRALRAAASC